MGGFFPFAISGCLKETHRHLQVMYSTAYTLKRAGDGMIQEATRTAHPKPNYSSAVDE